MNTYTIRQLTRRAGVSPRTVRFYVSEGLLDPPLGEGRGAVYTDDHVGRLESIKRLKAAGRTLDQVAEELGLNRPSRPSSLGAFALGLRPAMRRDVQRSQLWDPPGALASAVPALHASPRSPRPERWLRTEVAPGLELHAQRMSPAQLERLAGLLRDAMSQQGGRAEAEDEM